jgi:hypothetical protein
MNQKIFHLVLLTAAGILLYSLLPAPQETAAQAEGTATHTGYPTRTRTKTATRRLTRTQTATKTKTPSPTVTPSPTHTATPAGLFAWVEPSLNLKAFHPAAPLTLHFSLPVEPASAGDQPVLMSFPWIEGQASWDESFTTLIFQPDAPLVPKQQYHLFLNQNLKGRDGEGLNGMHTWLFSVGSGPKVTGRTLGEGTVPRRQPVIQLSFDRPMDTQSVEAALSVQPAVPLEISWQNNQLTIASTEVLTPGLMLAFTLDNRATDAEGAPLGEDYAFPYGVSYFYMQAQDFYYRNKVIWKSNYPIDTQASGLPFAISPRTDGEWKWRTDGSLQYTPAVTLTVGTTYTLLLTGPLVDTYGEIVATEGASFRFTTPLPFEVAYPEPGSRWVGGDTEIAVMLNFAADRPSFEAAFHLDPPVDGAFTWQRQLEYRSRHFSNDIIFKPEKWLEDGTYTIRIDPTVRDAQGNRVMTKPYEWQFTVHNWSYDTDKSFGYGPRVQVVDAGGRRAIQYNSEDGTPMSFALYPLELGQFTAWYEDPSKIPDLEGLEPAFSWGVSAGDWFDEVTLPDEAQPGLYLLAMRAEGKLQDHLFVALTHNALVVKRSGDDLFIWASSFEGENLADLEIRLYSDRGEKLRVGNTDENGIYRTTIPEGYTPDLVAARGAEGDVSIAGLSGIWGNYSLYSYGESDYTLRNTMAYLYTDRPIYRPGQAVYFKAIFRQEEDVRYFMLPAGTLATLRILDDRQNLLQTYEMNTNAFGTLNGVYTLTQGAMLGDYTLELQVGEESFRQSFKVEDYRKPDYQVKVSMNAERYAAGDTITVTVETSYYFGQPLANPKISIAAYTLQGTYWWWSWWDGSESEEGKDYLWMNSYSEHPAPKLVESDASGHYTYTLKAAMSDDFYRQTSWRDSQQVSTWGLEFSVDDGSGQTVSSSTIYKVYNAAEKISLSVEDYFQKPETPFTVQASALTLDGGPVAGRILDLRIWRENWGVKNARRIEINQSLATSGDGQAEFTVTLPEAGYYRLDLTSKDERDNPIRYTRWIYAYREDETWAREYDNEISITAEESSYRPYDTVRLLVESTFSGPALLTFERGSVLHSRPVVLTAPLTIIETQLIPEDAPNVFITINAWQAQDTRIPAKGTQEDWYWSWMSTLPDSRLRRAGTEVQVEVVGKRLNIEISTDHPAYAPRQEAEVTIQVTDEQGQPVQAELSLAMVDEAIYALASDPARPIFDGFYSRRRHSVGTYDSMGPTRYLAYDEGGQGGGGDGDYYGNPRHEFPDTAAWFPALRTNAGGQVTVQVKLPDNLTSWRLTAKAVTLNTQVGEVHINFLTQQAVVVRPQLPVGLVSGDQVELSALVHNYSDAPIDLLAAIQVNETDLSIHGPLTQSLALAAGEVKLVAWDATALEASEAMVTISAFPSPLTPLPGGEEKPGEIGDAVQLSIPIQPLAVPALAAQTGSFQGALDTVIPLPEGALGLSTVHLELSRSAAGELLTGLEYLTGYPYGCVEQTMSRALPNAVVGRAFEQLAVGDSGRKKNLDPLVRAGLDMLYGYQHNDGGWGWWYDDDSNDYQTAWVVFGLVVTAEAGYKIEPKVVERGAQWLQLHLAEMDIRTRAYALYSLAVAGYGDLEAVAALDRASRTELDPFSLASLALAYHKLGDADQANAILAWLADHSRQRDGLVYWPQLSEDGHYYEKTMASSTRSTALALDAFVQIVPDHPLIPGIVQWLMEQRRPDGWGSTNETSYTILALTDYLLGVRERLGSTQVSVEINGSPLFTATLDTQQPLASLEIPLEQLQAGANELRLHQISGTGEVYYRLTQRLVMPEAEIPAAGEVKIQREYLDPQTKKPIQAVASGQLVLVRLTVTLPDDSFFMILEDHLPGGMEALNEKLNTTSHVVAYTEDYGYGEQFYWQDYGYNNKEIRGGRVSFFIKEMGQGQHVFTYLARATRAGEFVALPAEAYAMYDDRVWGRSPSTRLVIAPR